jgi:hypothetical protein
MNKPFHPFLFAIYPILFLYSKNRTEFPPHVITGPILICTMFTLLAFAVLWIFSKNRLRSAVLLSVFLILFFSYGHLYQLIEKSGLTENPKTVLSMYGLILGLALVLCYRKIRDWRQATRGFNLFGIALIAIPLFGTASALFQAPRSVAHQTAQVPAQSNNEKPDIFYIILDGYPRQDILKQLHQFDNFDLLDFLKRKHFKVLENSHSNYPGTSLSLASSLNFSYLDELIPAEEIRVGNQWYLKKLIEKNRTMEFLKKQGYDTVAFDSGYFTTEIKSADHFYATGWFLNEFHEALLDTTPAWVIFKNIGRYEIQRRRILHILDNLANAKHASRPVFVFAHVMALHPPFVFGPNGEEINRGSSLKFWEDFREPSAPERSQQYRNQLTFINKKIKATIQSILANRKRPVFIVLQGDHGSSFVSPEKEVDFLQERFSILNAILLPSGNQLYDSMSPVNTFRVILNSLFQTNLPLLQDRSFYSNRDEPYRWKEVTAKLKDRM